MKKILGLVMVLAASVLGMNAVAGTFGAGDIVIIRVGDGTQPITNAGQTVFLDEYTPSSLSNAAANSSVPVPIQSIQLPTSWVGAQAPLVLDGFDQSQSELSRSVDGRYLALVGYGATLTGGATPSWQITNGAVSSATVTGLFNQVAHVVGLVDGNGHVYTSTAQTNGNEQGIEPRAAVTTDGTNIWMEGTSNPKGVTYLTRGSLVSTQVCTALSSYRALGIFGNPVTGSNTLYVDNDFNFVGATNTSGSVNPLGGSLPTSFAPTNFLPVHYVYAQGSGSAYDFITFNLQGGVGPDTLYVCDSTTNAPGEPLNHAGGVLKFCYIPASNAWINTGYIYAVGATWLTGVQSGTNVTLYITQGGDSTPVDVLYLYNDTSGFGGSPQNNGDGGDADGYKVFLGTASAPMNVANVNLINTRGIAIAPQGGDTGTITGPGALSVGPPYGAYWTGPAGGPFTPTNNFVYSLANLGGSSTNYNVTFTDGSGHAIGNWATITPASGSVAAGTSMNLTVKPTTIASTAPGGYTYVGTLKLYYGTLPLPAKQFATIQCQLVDYAFFVTPSTGSGVSNFISTGEVGGPFAPSNYVYTLSNATPGSLTWSAFLSNNWDSLSSTGLIGSVTASLPGLTATNITVSIYTNNADSLANIGSYDDSLVFSNLSVSPAAQLSAANTPEIILGVGFGVFDDFSTYMSGAVAGQNNWVGGTASDDPIQIAGGVWTVPGGCPGSTAQQPYKYISAQSLTTSVGYAVLGMTMTVTNGSPHPNYTFRIGSPNGQPDKNCAGTVDVGDGMHYTWSTELDQEQTDPTIGSAQYSYFQQYQVYLVSDMAGFNAWVLVNPGTNDLGTATNTSVATFTQGGVEGYTFGQATGWVDVIIGQYSACPSETQQGYTISRLGASTNFADVYAWLNPGPACTAPTASFTPASASGAAPLTVNFTDTSSGTPTSWYWAFGDGNTSTSENPMDIYANPGPYTAQLIASNACGWSTNTASITVYDPFAWWESPSVYNLTGTLTGGTASYTGDGMSNTNKFMAGFSPTNSAAYLHVIGIVRSNNNVTVTYLGANGDSTYVPGIAKRTNILEYSVGTANGSYTNNYLPTGQTNILSGGTGLGVVTNMVDQGIGGVTDRYYRVRVLLP